MMSSLNKITSMMLALGVMAFPCALLADAQRQAAPDQARAESAESFVNIARGSELVVSLGPNAGFAEKRAAALLIDAVTTRTGLKPTIGDPASSGHALVIGTAESHALVKEYLRNSASRRSSALPPTTSAPPSRKGPGDC
jgi:hypothetical protein